MKLKELFQQYKAIKSEQLKKQFLKGRYLENIVFNKINDEGVNFIKELIHSPIFNSLKIAIIAYNDYYIFRYLLQNSDDIKLIEEFINFVPKSIKKDFLNNVSSIYSEDEIIHHLFSKQIISVLISYKCLPKKASTIKKIFSQSIKVQCNKTASQLWPTISAPLKLKLIEETIKFTSGYQSAVIWKACWDKLSNKAKVKLKAKLLDSAINHSNKYLLEKIFFKKDWNKDNFCEELFNIFYKTGGMTFEEAIRKDAPSELLTICEFALDLDKHKEKDKNIKFGGIKSQIFKMIQNNKGILISLLDISIKSSSVEYLQELEMEGGLYKVDLTKINKSVLSLLYFIKDKELTDLYSHLRKQCIDKNQFDQINLLLKDALEYVSSEKLRGISLEEIAKLPEMVKAELRASDIALELSVPNEVINIICEYLEIPVFSVFSNEICLVSSNQLEDMKYVESEEYLNDEGLFLIGN